MNDNYINLANAIIIKAYKDYKRALRIIVKRPPTRKTFRERITQKSIESKGMWNRSFT